MNTEQLLIEKWRSLPNDRQEEVIAFIEFLASYKKSSPPENRQLESSQITDDHKAKSTLGQKLRSIREEIIASGVPLLSAEEIEKEKALRRGGYQGDDE